MQALTKADALRKEWGSIDIPESMFVAAHDTLDVIEKEEVVLREVSVAMSSGKLGGKPGAVDVSRVDTSRLEAVMERAKSVAIRTKLGVCLLSFAKVIRDLRASFRAADFLAVEAAVAYGKQLIASIQESRQDADSSGLPADCALEFQLAVNELDDRAVIK